MSYPHYDTDSAALPGYLYARPCGNPIGSCPIPGSPTQWIIRQEFTQRRDKWNECPLNTEYIFSFLGASYDFQDFILVGESETNDIGGGVVKWTRTYALIPTMDQNEIAHKQPTQMSYRFIQLGYPSIVNGSNIWPYFTDTQGHVINFRPGFQQTVPAWIEFAYFLIGPGTNWATVQELEVDKYIPEYFYAANQPFSVQRKIAADFLIQENNVLYSPTTPSIEQYMKLVGWDVTTNPPIAVAPTAIVAQASSFARWPAAPQGNIIERQTIKLFPK